MNARIARLVVLALCLAAPALAEDIALPPLPEAADVVISAADHAPSAAETAIEHAMPAPPEPATVVLDIAPEDHDKTSPLVTASIPPDPLAPESPRIELPALPLTTDDLKQRVGGELLAALPAPDAADVDLSVIALPRDVSPAFTGIAALPAPVVAEPVLPSATAVRAGPAAADIAAELAGKLAALVRQPWLPEAEQGAVLAFYEARQHAPLWHDGDRLTENGHKARLQLAAAAQDGLRAVDYRVAAHDGSVPAIAEADIRLSLAALRYARDARGGRIDPRRLSALITPKLALPSAAPLLGELATSADAGATLAGYLPVHQGYKALRAKLAELRQAKPVATEPMVRVPIGPTLRIGMRDDRIELIRARFGLGPDGGKLYDRSLSTVVAGFQRENGLPATGVLTRATQAALNGAPASDMEADIIATMERWRWLPTNLGDEHLFVNVPEFMVRKVEDGAIVHEARIVVGKTERPTPIFSDMMDHLVMNPSWTIPPTILRQDILPKLASDPGYAERRGFEVIRRGNQITVRQPPGPSNALGNVKFMFPNDHAVYLHDTPSRNLFASARRAYSSGCIRVERPMKLASLVLGGDAAGWSERRLTGLVGSGERTIRLSRKLPIHITYMTMTVTPAGELRSHEDLYGFHRRTREALGL
ncbi:MAG: L,D-transpeptidase family protein [Hyphomicrobiales bacterium]|nr:L,D-transpeptidase family protein [Hyphomicrobiales bacterium]